MFARRFLLSPVLILALPGCDALPMNSGAVQWNSSRPPIYMELDGDDALDAIGWVRVQRAGNLSPRVAAFAGRSGRQLWISPMLSTIAEEHLAQFGFAGGRIIVVDPGGRAQAFVPNVETPEWSVDLGERAVEICDGGPAEVVVVTKDGKARTLAVADGAGRPVVPPAVCIPTGAAAPAASRAHWDAAGRWPGVRVPPAIRPPARPIPDMASDSLLRPTPELSVVLGSKAAGTRVPMVAVLRGEQVLWSSVVPEREPLRATADDPDIAAADERAVFVSYEISDSSWRVAAFALVDGQRLWDVPIADSITGDLEMLVPVGDRLLVAHWTYLKVLDRNTGALRHTIGSW